MKIEPKTNYIKPAYAVGASALIAATLFTGCPADKAKNRINVRHKDPKETELQIAGDVQYIPDETDETEETELELMGDTQYVPDVTEETDETEEFILDGDVAYVPDGTDDLQWKGEEAVCDPAESEG